MNNRYEFRNNSCTPIPHTIPSNNCDLFFIKPNGIVRCAIPKDCRNLELFYLLEYECKKKCDDYYYKLDDTFLIDSVNVPFYRCYLGPSYCLAYLQDKEHKTKLYFIIYLSLIFFFLACFNLFNDFINLFIRDNFKIISRFNHSYFHIFTSRFNIL